MPTFLSHSIWKIFFHCSYLSKEPIQKHRLHFDFNNRVCNVCEGMFVLVCPYGCTPVMTHVGVKEQDWVSVFTFWGVGDRVFLIHCCGTIRKLAHELLGILLSLTTSCLYWSTGVTELCTTFSFSVGFGALKSPGLHSKWWTCRVSLLAKMLFF